MLEKAMVWQEQGRKASISQNVSSQVKVMAEGRLIHLCLVQ